MNHRKRVSRMIEEYGLAGKLPMFEWQLLKFRGVGAKALAEFRRRGHVKPDPCQWMLDIHPKLDRLAGEFANVDALKDAIARGRFKLNRDSTVHFDNRPLRAFGAIVLKAICEKIGVPVPPLAPSMQSIRVPKIEAATGARVMFCGHQGWFLADIFPVGGAVVVRAADRIDPGTLVRGQNEEATHHVQDWPDIGFWRPDLGVLVVPAQQIKRLK